MRMCVRRRNVVICFKRTPIDIRMYRKIIFYVRLRYSQTKYRLKTYNEIFLRASVSNLDVANMLCCKKSEKMLESTIIIFIHMYKHTGNTHTVTTLIRNVCNLEHNI